MKQIVRMVALACAGWLGTPAAQTTEVPKGYSNWDMQVLHGNQFREPGNPNEVAKGIVTFENSSGWSWGSSYFFVDILRSDGSDQHATEVYSEWYPSASLSKLSGNSLSAGPLRDVSVTLGLNAGTKSTGAAPLEDQTIVISDGKIQSIAPSASAKMIVRGRSRRWRKTGFTSPA